MSKASKKVTSIQQASEKQPEEKRALSPFSDMERYFFELEKSMFGGHILRPSFWPFTENANLPFAERAPKVDVIDRENDILVKAEMPGVSKDDVDISLSDHHLTIKAQKSREEKEEKENYYRREISKSSFSRSVMLPESVDIDQASASFKDGILEITLPKTEQAKRRSIKIS